MRHRSYLHKTYKVTLSISSLIQITHWGKVLAFYETWLSRSGSSLIDGIEVLEIEFLIAAVFFHWDRAMSLWYNNNPFDAGKVNMSHFIYQPFVTLEIKKAFKFKALSNSHKFTLHLLLQIKCFSFRFWKPLQIFWCKFFGFVKPRNFLITFECISKSIYDSGANLQKTNTFKISG